MKIKKWTNFILESQTEISDIFDYLSKLGSSEINNDIEELKKTTDEESISYLIENILLEVSELVSDEDYHKVENELKKLLK